MTKVESSGLCPMYCGSRRFRNGHIWKPYINLKQTLCMYWYCKSWNNFKAILKSWSWSSCLLCGQEPGHRARWWAAAGRNRPQILHRWLQLRQHLPTGLLADPHGRVSGAPIFQSKHRSLYYHHSSSRAVLVSLLGDDRNLYLKLYGDKQKYGNPCFEEIKD